MAVAAARTVGTSPHRRHRLSRLSGPLPRHGDIAWLRRTYRLGRDNAMTVVSPEACPPVSNQTSYGHLISQSQLRVTGEPSAASFRPDTHAQACGSAIPA